MEAALNELRLTLGKATAYMNDDAIEKYAPIIRSHIADVLEDAQLLQKFKANYGTKADEISALLSDVTHFKRDSEKEAYALEMAEKRAEQPAVLVYPDTASTGSGGSVNSSMKLPRLKLPTFDGESSTDYRGFMDAFEESISLDSTMSDVRKFLVLKAQLTGTALKLVDTLPTAKESFGAATTILDDTYGGSKRAILRLYERVQNLPVAAMETENLRLTYAQLEGILLSLAGLGEKLDENCFLRAVVLSKYPDELIHLLRVTDDTPLSVFRRAMSAYIKQRDCVFRSKVQLGVRNEPSGSGTKGGAGGSQSKKPRHGNNAISFGGGGTGTPAPSNKVTVSDKSKSALAKREPKVACIFCSGTHWADECDKVTAIDERLKLVADRCHRCLRPKHGEEQCKNKRVCFYCKAADHNSALCPTKFAKVLLAQDSEATSRFITAVLPVGNVSRTKSAEARTVLDTAGGRSLITADLVAQLELGASGDRKARFIGVNRVPLAGEPASSRRLTLFPSGQQPIEIDVFVVPEIVDNVEATSVAEIKKQYPRYASLPMPREGNGERVQLLLGYRALTSIVTLHRSIQLTQSLQLLSTKFGWIPFGGLPGEDEEKLDSSVIGLLKEEDPVRLMSDLELVGLSDFLKTENEEEAVVLDKYYKTIKRFGKRYEVEWPYRSDEPEIEDNFGLAFGRLQSLFRQLKKDPALLEAYDRIIKTQLEEGVVETVNMRAKTRKNLVHYLPHRGVIRLNKSTPIRMVFDAAARSGKLSRCLNDLIMKGGNWVNDIPGVLMRFRRYGVAVTTDIVKAFHQISIAPKDRDVVRFLWLRDPKKPPSKENIIVYRFTRMAFGVVASPFLLTATIKHHLRTYPNEFAEIIERDLYADNLITSLPRHVDGEKFYRTVTNCFNEMSMQLAQWSTDDPNLRKTFAPEEMSIETEQGVLGLEWNIDKRTMRVKSPRLAEVDGVVPTKRVVLKEMATVYDPLGWMAPVVLIARLFLRRIWDLKYDWERPIPSEMAEEWRTIRRQLNRVAEIFLPRAYGFHGIENAYRYELHAFCDASTAAYGVVVYLCVYENEQPWKGIVAAKARLAPKTKISVPRLELLAAVTACRFIKYVESSLQLEKQPTKYLWSDAKCVIAWSNSKKILPAFVDKAVKAIHATDLRAFQYVPTTANPADLASRGATVDELREKEWWNGPNWLTDQESWPAQICEQQPNLEIMANDLQIEDAKILFFRSILRLKKIVDPESNEGAPFGFNPNDYQRIGQLMRKTAIAVKAASRFLRGRGTIPRITQLDYHDARLRWFRWDQQRIYEPSETRNTNASYLKNLRASLDDEGVIRCDSRIRRAKVTRETANPILLVKKSALTNLIIRSLHHNNNHAGTSHTLTALRKRYWLPQGRREVYTTLQGCHKCQRAECQPFADPNLAELPEFRINMTETPFQNVGVDVLGPFKVRVGRDKNNPKEKRWVILFTCLVVRAVHLEVLHEMGSEEFMNAFRRFVGRRGVPKLIVSDNAPQFEVVDRVFHNIWHHFANAHEHQTYYAEHDIKWKFIPPKAPWMGGAYERLIKEVKRAFHKIYGSLIPFEHQFELAVIEIEAMINSRPITYVDREEETEIITPNDFLRVRYPAIPVDFEKPIQDRELITAWKASEEYLNQFWKLWSELYVREIRERRDAKDPGRYAVDRTPAVGEVVFMADPNIKRRKWRLAVVERLCPDDDGTIRAVQIRTGLRTRMKRPVSKLAPLKLLMEIPANVEEVGELTNADRAIIVNADEGELTGGQIIRIGKGASKERGYIVDEAGGELSND